MISEFLSGTAFKLIMYGVIALLVSGVLYKGYSIIKKNGQYEIMIDTQSKALENKNKQIELIQKQLEIQDKFVKERDIQLQEMEEKLNNMLNDLGKDSGDQAADSLKEYFKRLGQI